MEVVVTGASGFLGKYVVASFLEKGYDVIALSRQKNKLEKLSILPNYSYKETDYSLESLQEITQNTTVIVHLASQLMQRNTNMFEISKFSNLNLLENLLIAASINKVEKVIQTSSISVYDKAHYKNSESESNLVPSTIYGLSKLYCDLYANYFAKKQPNIDIISLRLARLYGYGEREGLMFTDFIKKAKNKEELTLYGNGSSSIEYIYVKDVVEAINKSVSLQQGFSGILNIGTSKLLTVKEIAEKINKVFNNHTPISFTKPNHKDVEGVSMKIEKASEILNWEAKWTLDKALNDLYQYEKK